MIQKGSQSVDVIFTGKKVQRPMTARRRELVEYAKRLDEDLLVESYEVSVELVDWVESISLAGIRKSYQGHNWYTDCVITYGDGRRAVRELVKREDLTKRSEVEKLEISRRYWAHMQVDDWSVVII